MSLTIGAVASGVGSAISGVAQGAITVIKIVASVGFAVLFASAITALFGYVEQLILTSVVGEFLNIVSLCLPFHAGTVFGGLVFVFIAITAFLVAKKVYELVSNLIKTSGA